MPLPCGPMRFPNRNPDRGSTGCIELLDLQRSITQPQTALRSESSDTSSKPGRSHPPVIPKLFDCYLETVNRSYFPVSSLVRGHLNFISSARCERRCGRRNRASDGYSLPGLKLLDFVLSSHLPSIGLGIARSLIPRTQNSLSSFFNRL